MSQHFYENMRHQLPFAEVTTPMWKLCMLYFGSSKPIFFKIFEALQKCCLVKWIWLVINSGPFLLPLKALLTGYTAWSVIPTTPCLKGGSVFDCLMVTRTTNGVILLSVAISFTARCTSGSNSCCVGMVNSEQWRKKGNTESYPHHY